MISTAKVKKEKNMVNWNILIKWSENNVVKREYCNLDKNSGGNQHEKKIRLMQQILLNSKRTIWYRLLFTDVPLKHYIDIIIDLVYYKNSIKTKPSGRS